MCTVLLPPGDNPIAVNKYIIYHILSQFDSIHTPTSYFLKTHLNIILPSTPGSSKWSLSLRLLHQNPVYASFLLHAYYMPLPSYSSRFYHPHNIE